MLAESTAYISITKFARILSPKARQPLLCQSLVPLVVEASR